MINIDDLKERYKSIYGLEGCSVKVLREIEKVLETKLPTDFKEIANFYSGGLLGGISHYEIASAEGASAILQETLRLRKAVGINKDYVVLAEPPGSLIVMNVVSGVLWCDANDAENINSKAFENEPDRWDCYASFFNYLLDREESE